MTWTEPDLSAVPVPGGDLTVGRWGSGSTAVVASHGITANHRSFAEVAHHLRTAGADVSLYAVDHRGRGGSASVPGPCGLEVHARDLLAVVDHLDVDQVVFVGHSMGAYVVACAAELAPDRVRGVVLIDGALPIPVQVPEDADIEELVRGVIGPALDRLDRTFASPEEYVAMWQEHPAVGGRYFSDVAEAYVRYDLIADGDRWRSPVRKDAVLEDGRSVLVDEGPRTAVSRLAVPTTLLWAPRGLLDQEPGLFPPDVVDQVVPSLGHVDARRIDDTNHYSIVLTPEGASAVAAAIGEHVA
jgi:pimeloyl-ACP methyl ester carboxylesterase